MKSAMRTPVALALILCLLVPPLPILALAQSGPEADEAQALQAAAQVRMMSEAELAVAQAILEDVNQRRTQRKVPPLTQSEGLTASAVLRAEEIYQSFSTTRPDGSKYTTAYEGAWEKYAEQLYRGPLSAKKIVSYFVKSEKQSKAFLSKQYTHIGIGIFTTPTSQAKEAEADDSEEKNPKRTPDDYESYVIILLMRPAGELDEADVQAIR